MDDQPLDLSKKSAPSNTEYQLFPKEKKQESVEVHLHPIKSVSNEKNLLKTIRMSEKLVEQESMKPKLASQTRKTHEDSKYGDKVPKSCDIMNRRKNEKSGTNSGTKRLKSSDSATKNNYEQSILSEKNCGEKSSAECAPHILLTSADTSCSYNAQGNLRKSKNKSPFVCEYCSKVFFFNSKYELHVRTHTGEKPFGCQYCNKSFSKKSHLIEHIRLHTGERPFRCQECNRAFVAKYILKRHQKVHLGEKPFICEICNKAFKTKWYFKIHKNNHTNKPKENTEN